MQIMKDKILRERFMVLLRNAINKNTARIVVMIGKDQYLVENFGKDGRDLVLSAPIKI